MILPETTENQLLEIADKSCDDVQNLKIPAASNHHLPYVSVNIGAGTHTPHKDEHWSFFIEHKALYQAKSNGRNQVSTGIQTMACQGCQAPGFHRLQLISTIFKYTFALFVALVQNSPHRKATRPTHSSYDP